MDHQTEHTMEQQTACIHRRYSRRKQATIWLSCKKNVYLANILTSGASLCRDIDHFTIMKENILLRPFSVSAHLAVWAIYFVGIGYINVRIFGPDHLWAVILLMPLMLAIVYLNRYGLRQLIRKRGAARRLWLPAVGMLLLFPLGYILLHKNENALSYRILSGIETIPNGWTAYLIDSATFYCSFAFKGLVLAGTEMLYGLLRERAKATWLRQREHQISRWIVHFMGNFGHSSLHTLQAQGHSALLQEAHTAIWARGIRIMSRPGHLTEPLSDEIAHLKYLMEICPIQGLQFQVSGDTGHTRILPMLLLTLYKNMYKHGAFGGGEKAVFHIERTDARLRIYTCNEIARQSAWMYGAGGTGLEQLEDILAGEYGGWAQVDYKGEDNIFYLRIEIPLTDEPIKHDLKAGTA